jgi:membrane-bound serine protease (ClpP class)
MPLASASRTIFLLLFVAIALFGLAGATLAQTQPPQALILNVDGIINSVKQRYISRAIQQAEAEQATLVIIQLDTPGGLLDSTREIVEELLGAEVPVAVYVSPPGARAGSAGTFITAAANFAVMAPGTNIGAATPVSGTGEDLDKTLASKVTNDAAALIRSIAQKRGRNQEKLEETVRNAVSFTADEAVELNVVDFIAKDLNDLLAQLDGQVTETAAGPRTLDTSNLRRSEVDRNLLESILEFISDPNISFLLLTIGTLGVIIELFNPGLIVPGVIGGISLLLAFLALGNLPVNWAGVAFILLAVGLAVAETQVSGFGILGIGSIISFIVGGLLLFAQFGDASPTLPAVSVSRWLLGGMAGAMALAILYIVRVIYQSRKGGPPDTSTSLVGAVGTVTTELAPRGVVQVGSETWTAVSEDDSVIGAGVPIKVTKVDGLILTVSRRQNKKDT